MNLNKGLTITCFLIFICNLLFSQNIIPTERITNWSNAGLADSLPVPDTVINITDFGAIPDDNINDDNAFQAALAQSAGQIVEIFIPAGEYNLTQTINLPSGTYIKGESAYDVLLNFNLSQAHDLISAKGTISQDSTVIQNLHKFDTSLTYTDSTANFEPGDILLINQNAVPYVTSSWAEHTMGQIVKVKDTTGNKLFIDSEIRHNYPDTNNPVIIKINPARNIGISSLSIKRSDSQSLQLSNIKFEYVRNAKIHAIISSDCIFSHVSLMYSSQIIIEGSYFHHAHDYGGGGRAYGVEISFSSGECLVVNNIFEHLRHSMLLQAGANGNVFAYNYSKDPYWDEGFLPAESAGDLVLHGNYPYLNLFEGNIAQNLVVDNSHGENGPNNTFFRNRLEKYGIFMNSSPATDSVIYVGNEITDNGYLTGMYQLEGSGHIEYANLQYDIWHPSGTNSYNKTSLFRNYAPCYFIEEGIPFPFIGPPHPLGNYKNPAQLRYIAGEMVFEGCDTSVNINRKRKDFSVYPNPASDKVFIKTNCKESFNLIIYNSLGIQVKSIKYQSGRNKIAVNIKDLKSGIYFIHSPNLNIKQKIIVD